MKRLIGCSVLHAFAVLVAGVILTAGSFAAVPVEVLVNQEEKGCCGPRIELTGGDEAYYWETNGQLMSGSVIEQDGNLLFEFKRRIPKTMTVALSADGNGWIDQNNTRWVTRTSLLERPQGWTDVEIRVGDQDGVPFEDFGYRYRIIWKEGHWNPLLVRSLPGKDGKIRISAPEECEIYLDVDHPDCVGGYGSERALGRTKESGMLEARFEKGQTISGRVVDAVTGNPVKGAWVSPNTPTSHSDYPNYNRTLVTPEEGTFELRGVGSSFVVEHANYAETVTYRYGENPPVVYEVRLDAGQAVRGIVTGPDHKPLGGVRVSDERARSMTTKEDGSFSLKGMSNEGSDRWVLQFSKEGFKGRRFVLASIEPGQMKVEMEELPRLRGVVVLPDGTPAARYQLVCGPAKDPASYNSIKRVVEDPAGKFEVQPEDGRQEGDSYWLGIRAEGAAPWDGVVSLNQLTGGDFRIVLEKGAGLSASFESIVPLKGALEVGLDPLDRIREDSFVSDSHAGVSLASQKISVTSGDPLRISNLRDGRYRLSIRGDGFSPVSLPVSIQGADLDLGLIRLAGTGSISGIVRPPQGEKGTAWRFVDGEISISGFDDGTDEPFRKFKADGEGRFKVADVPSGDIWVSVFDRASGHMVSSVSRKVRVIEGSNTEVRFEGDGGAWTRPVQLRFDGKDELPVQNGIREVDNVTDRPPLFRFDVSSADMGPSSGPGSHEWWTKTKASVAIPDLSPGRWRIRVSDMREHCLRAEVVAEVDDKPLVIDLGAGTLSGRLTSPRGIRRWGDVVAVAKEGDRVYQSDSDLEGDFVIRYLPQGVYRLHAHGGDNGWCDLGEHLLDKPVVDCGEHELKEGGSVEGVWTDQGVYRVDGPKVRIVAPDGFEIIVDDIKDDGRFRVDNLRPGPWTVLIPSRAGEARSHAVEIEKGRTVTISSEK